MSKDTIWEAPAHTLAKLDLLRGYLRAWFPILAQSSYPRVIFLDGFAGPGIYKAGEPGSPIVALKTLVEHDAFARLAETTFEFIFVERRPDRFESLKHEVDGFWIRHFGSKPTNVRTRLYNSAFADVAEGLISGGHFSHDPVLAFVDPFGWSAIPMSMLSDLLLEPGREALINFPYNNVSRFVDHPDPTISNQISGLFGTNADGLLDVHHLQGNERKEYLCGLYLSQLQARVGFAYAKGFEMVDDDRNRTAYYMMFGSHHRKGLEVMKEAMWNLDPVYGTRFRGSVGDQEVLFQLEPDMAPLRNAILSRFDNHKVHSEDVKRFVVEDTDYLESHCRQVLKELEQEGRITCSNRRKSLTYPDGTMIEFHSDFRTRLF